ncbi:MAG: carboxylating nicotinate-nucleotide diphosphorylase [Thermoplasmatota archaeon]
MDWIAAYLEEDRALHDVTSQAIFSNQVQGAAIMRARDAGCIAGIEAAIQVFERVDCLAVPLVQDGVWVDAGAELMRIEGPVRGLLVGERLALNMVGRMSGIATQVRPLVERLAKACSGAVIAGTRKTTPGFRAFEKAAIVIAGGAPHRMTLEDEAMIKDNHREAAGSVAAAVQAVKAAHPETILTTEIESLEDALAAAEAGTDWIMIDNQTPATGQAWAKAVWAAHPNVKIEASGGIGPDDVASYGWADRISLGWITHHAVSLDVGLDWEAA